MMSKKYTKHRSKHTIYFYSYKNACQIWCESNLERSYALSLEFDESVLRYASQPESFEVYGRTYTPDFLVEYRSGRAQYTEVKHTHFVNDEFRRLHPLREEVIRQLTGLPLQLVTDADIDKVVKDNQDLLLPFRSTDISALIPLLKDLPQKLSLLKLEAILTMLKGFERSHAWALLAHQYFHFDMRTPLNPYTVLVKV